MHKIQHFRVEVGPGWWCIHDNVTNALQACAFEEMSSFGIQQEMGTAMEEHVTSTCDLFVFRVFGDLDKTEFVLLEEVPDPNVVKVTGDINETMRHCRAFILREHCFREVVETFVEGLFQ